MANTIKCNIVQRICKHVKISSRLLKIAKNKKRDDFFYRLQLKDSNLLDDLKNSSTDLKCNNIIDDIEIEPINDHFNVNFYLNKNTFISDTIHKSINPMIYDELPPSRKIIEYSSPNIAKPFHVGHLRSTIVGNFIANINTHMNDNVTRLNFLGDWGTQFGLLKVGIELCNLSTEDIRANPMENLYRAYVKVNKLAENDSSIATKAREIFSNLENGDLKAIEEWNLYRELTMNELNITYNRLGTTFDEYNWESMYSSKVIQPILEILENKNVIKVDSDGKKIAVVDNRNVTIMKSDGSSLYLSRDIAAAHDRYSKYNFDEMLYIVDSSQSDHFKALFSILNQMKSVVAEKCKHVAFGRINGMSTRKGKVVFLQDILDEAKDRMNKKQANTKTTKVSLNDDSVTDTLGISAVLINDLKQRRERNYDFSWERALQNSGDSGIKLQYLHCRLYSIEQNCGITVPKECNPEFLQEPEVMSVIYELARFDDVLEESRIQMEACILVAYLFNLSNMVNKGIKVLNVKNQPKEIGEQRLMLFHAARLVIKKSLEILGVKPLNQM